MWSVPRLWPGQSCAILASGFSMSQEVADTVRYTRLRTIVINTTFQLAPWADMLYAADSDWWQEYKATALKFAGLKVTCSPTPYDDVLQLNNSGPLGFDPNPANVRTCNANSGGQAIHVAAHAGCTRILLCGFDMHGGNWHGKHPRRLRNAGKEMFERWLPGFDPLGDDLEKRGVEVVNCTPDSRLKRFRMADLKEEIEAQALATA